MLILLPQKLSKLQTIGYLNNPSKIAEMQELEHWKTKFDIAGSATEGFFSKQWLAKKLFNMSDEEFVRNRREMFYDKRFEAALETVGEAEQAQMTAGIDAGVDELEAGGDTGEPGGTGVAGMEPEISAGLEVRGESQDGRKHDVDSMTHGLPFPDDLFG